MFFVYILALPTYLKIIASSCTGKDFVLTLDFRIDDVCVCVLVCTPSTITFKRDTFFVFEKKVYLENWLGFDWTRSKSK